MKPETKKVLLLLAEGFEIYEASAFIDVFGWNLVEGDRSTRLHTCALRREIRSAFGQEIRVDFLASEISVDEYAALAVPGGFEEFHFYADAYAKEFSELIAQFHRRGKPIASVCTGALPLAKSGILRGKRGTTYSQNPARQEALRGMGAELAGGPIVTDGNITTSWDPSTALDVAFLLLEALTSPENALAMRRRMGFGSGR